MLGSSLTVGGVLAAARVAWVERRRRAGGEGADGGVELDRAGGAGGESGDLDGGGGGAALPGGVAGAHGAAGGGDGADVESEVGVEGNEDHDGSGRRWGRGGW